MRLGRRKQFRKTLQFFRSVYGFREPFRILVDGSFLAAVLRTKQDPREFISSALGVRITLVVTRSILREISLLGSDFRYILEYAQKLKIIQPKSNPSAFDSYGEHVPNTSDNQSLVDEDNISTPSAQSPSTSRQPKQDARPSTVPESVLGILDGENPLHVVVATQDRKLREHVRTISGVPILYMQRSVLILEKPSDQSIASASSVRRPSTGMCEEERQLLFGDQQDQTSVIRRMKKKRPNPNPLSVLPKKKKMTSNLAETSLQTSNKQQSGNDSVSLDQHAASSTLESQVRRVRRGKRGGKLNRSGQNRKNEE